MRGSVQAEIQAIADLKIVNVVEAQKNYAKQYRVNVHNWSYGRLIKCITSQAAKLNIEIEQGKQPYKGSAQEKARDLAVNAYQARK